MIETLSAPASRVNRPSVAAPDKERTAATMPPNGTLCGSRLNTYLRASCFRYYAYRGAGTASIIEGEKIHV